MRLSGLSHIHNLQAPKFQPGSGKPSKIFDLLGLAAKALIVLRRKMRAANAPFSLPLHSYSPGARTISPNQKFGQVNVWMF